MNLTDAAREIGWNIQYIWIMYPLFLAALTIGGYGIYRRIRRWRIGQPAACLDEPAKRLKHLGKHALLQIRLIRNVYEGLFHHLIFVSFMILTLATILVLIEFDFGILKMKGLAYLYFQSLLVDICGGLAMVGIALAGIRRWVWRPQHQVASWEANLILIWLFLILLTGFGVEGLRMAATQDPWAVWSPLGHIAANISTGMVAVETLPLIHRLMWWGHLVLAMGFIAWAPYTKMIHVLTAPFNIYTANPAPGGANLKTIVFDEAETLGVKALSGFTWKDLADLDACTECGRCSQICPAASVGKTLSPRDIILALRARLHAQDKNPPEPTDASDRIDSKLIDTASAVSAAALWECTTCGACLEACPVFIEQFPKIVDLRRYLVMEEADFPENIQEAMLSLENRGHPFRGVQTTRLDWTAGLEVPLLSDKQKTDILLWVGSTGALQERNQKAISALAQLLIRAGVDFAILGREEKSTGDLARRVGNEFLFESLARENIETLGAYQFTAIVTPCPHAYNTLKNEYPRLGGRYTVYHHSEYLVQLLKAGKLKCTPTPTAAITYHDPCYLGRHNRIFEPPRDLIRACSGSTPLEMANCRNLSFCCGGGGGMNFMEEPVEQRLNRERARQVLATGVDTVAVACPTCLSVLEDGVNGLQGEKGVRVVDIAELLWEAIQR